jgi:hypothetical protein
MSEHPLDAARRAVRETQAAKENLLARVVEGEPITQDELLAADDEHAKALRIETIEVAKAKGAQKRANEQAIEVLAGKAKELQDAYDEAVEALIASASVVDDRVSAAADALEVFSRLGNAVKVAHEAMNQHNIQVMSYLPTSNPVLAAMHPSQRPRCRTEQNGVGLFRPEVELAATMGMGWDKKRHVIHSLEANLRLQFRRPHVRDGVA